MLISLAYTVPDTSVYGAAANSISDMRVTANRMGPDAPTRQTDTNIVERASRKSRLPANRYQITIMSCFGRRAWDPKGKVKSLGPIRHGGKEQTILSSTATSPVAAPDLDWRFQFSSPNRAQMCQSSHATRKILRRRLRNWR